MSSHSSERQRASSAVATVVVPVRNDARRIARCLGGLARQCVAADVIVVDDGSTDDTADVARRHGARVLSSGGRGAAAARNVGVRSARSEIVLFTDADCIPCPGWARGLLEPFRDPRVVASKGTYRSRQGSATARFVQAEYEERYGRMRSLREIDFLDTYSLAVRRRDLMAVGAFDERFSGASVEDQEMSFRLHARGKFIFVPGAVVEHQHVDSPSGYFRKKLKIGRGKATLLRRYRDRARGDSHTPKTLVVQVPIVLAAVLLWTLAPFYGGGVWAVAVALSGAPMPMSLGLIRRCVGKHGFSFLGPAVGLVLVRAWALALGFAWGVGFPSARWSEELPCGKEPDSRVLPPESSERLLNVDANLMQELEVLSANESELLGRDRPEDQREEDGQHVYDARR